MKVKVEEQDRVTTVIINRPEVRNAVDGETAAELAAAFRQFDSDPEQWVAVLTGEGDAFCAGADLKAIAQAAEVSGAGVAVQPDGDGPLGPSRMLLSKPVIAAINGPAVAGGLELALWCDLRVMEEDAYLGVFCRRWGVPLIDGGTVRLPRLIGLSRALDLILTGRSVYAQEALSMGLVNRVAAVGTGREAAERLALELTRFPQTCMRSDRASAYEQFDLPFAAAIRNEFEHGQCALATETLAGAQRFVEGKGRGGSFEDL